MTFATIAHQTQTLVDFLRNPASYPESPSRVDLVETHISWVFLTDQFAYKLKKPVQFQFLDFSDLQARKLACEQEVLLNRRLSHHVYLSTLPITMDQHQGLALDGSGEEVDRIVKMRRLPSAYALDQLIRQRKLRKSEISALSKYLIEYYVNLPPKVLQPQDHHKHLVQHCQANLADLLKLLGNKHETLVRRVHGAQLRYLTLQDDLLYDRVRDGRIVDGHGDLRAEHIYLESPPSVIDCVEFAPELREVDALDDLSFLAVDCQRLGNSELGNYLLAGYQQASEDDAPPNLVSFYKCYRACVRAKVAALSIQQSSGTDQKQFMRQLHQYLNWADHYAAQLGPPTLVVTGGLMGSGKSTLAARLAETLGAEQFSTDELRHSLFGMSPSPAQYGEANYQNDLRQHVYQKLLSRAGSVLDESRSVILDGTFLTNDLRRAALDLCKRHGARGLIVECKCEPEVALERIAARAEASDTKSEARTELYNQQLEERETPDVDLPLVHVDSTHSLNQELQTIYKALGGTLFAT